MVLVVLLKQILLIQVSLKPFLGPGAGRAGWGLAGLGCAGSLAGRAGLVSTTVRGMVTATRAVTVFVGSSITGVIMTLVIARVVIFKGSISNTSFIGSSRVGNGFEEDMVQEPIALDDKDQSGLKVSQELVNTQLFLSTTPIAVCTAQLTALMASLTRI
ncbi:hypothetical protein BY996DRAFT_6417628 [Phakopsora pachyrhizi]|nr:hypothetical protein BY996DRAFT_6417628 [Phakopsora pachyrhizi]